MDISGILGEDCLNTGVKFVGNTREMGGTQGLNPQPPMQEAGSLPLRYGILRSLNSISFLTQKNFN